jgi:glycosyltransferase involved in cell wall biosynthesis
MDVYGTGGTHKFVQFFKLVGLIRRLCRQHKYDVITTQDAYFLGLLGVFASWRYRTGLEIQVHGIEKDTFVRSMLARFVYAHADTIRVVSGRLAAHIVKRYSVDEQKIILIPMFVDVSSLGLSKDATPIKPAEATQQDTFNLCFVGRLVPVKNVGLQIRAIAQLLGIHPKVHLHIVGDGPEKTALQKEVATFGLEEQVTFHGYQKGRELGAIYQTAQAFVLTSYSEGFGMVLVEAMHAGLPILATDVGIVGDILKKDSEVIIVDACNEQVLADAIVSLIENPARRKQLSDAVKEKAKTLDSFSGIVQKYVAAWERAKMFAK